MLPSIMLRSVNGLALPTLLVLASACTPAGPAVQPTAASKPTEVARPAGSPAAAVASPAASLAASPAVSPGPAGSPADRLRTVAANLDTALAALAGGDIARSRQAFESFDEGWDGVEDDVKARSPAAYKAIEDAMDEVEAALVKNDKPDPARARDVLTNLKQTIESNLPALR